MDKVKKDKIKSMSSNGRLLHPVLLGELQTMIKYDIHLKDFEIIGSCESEKCLLCKTRREEEVKIGIQINTGE